MVTIQKKSHDEIMLEEISKKRELMMNCAIRNGFTSEDTIRFSQELDELLNEYQRERYHISAPYEECRFSFRQMILHW